MKNKPLKAYPVTRLGWHKFYVEQYEKNPTALFAQLANWHYMLYYAFGDN